MKRRPVAVDLFAGCGGLSLGLREAGFNVTAAVEVDPAAAATYRANHRRVHVVEGDIRRISGRELRAVAGGGAIDLVAGCAPCQGFCSLTRKVRRRDPRNGLILEMARLVVEIRPRLVLMENVPGLLTVGRSLFARFLRLLEDAGYESTYGLVQMADYGVPQYRRRVVLVAGRRFQVGLPSRTYNSRGVGLPSWRTVREAIYGRPAPPTFARSRKNGGPRKLNWHVVRDIRPETKARLRAAVPGKTWLAVDEAVRPSCHRDGYQGFMNTYGRMTWDQASPTITAGCTSPCKGRFGHPDRRRTTISVREAARLQTFPEYYDFATESIEAACEMIGNAVPPLFARLVGRSLIASLG